jgi:hypothetical protein
VAASALLDRTSGASPRFPGEDGGSSLAEMAQSDLDAALQLLAERAQYITGASGAAIALRRGEHHDMLCRASTGSNAPELGALLSMEYGLSGESVRSRQLLRCDDAERDPRVNHDVCRELGIASVVVMPIVSQEQVLGVFELLSGKPRAFGERDLSALLRLSEMVETAVNHAIAAQVTSPFPPAAVTESMPASPPEPEVASPEISQPEPAPPAIISAQPAPAPPTPAAQAPEPQATPAPQKPLFWSAAMRTQASAPASPSADTIPVPPVLRNLHKCQVCGFPVSQGRTFCVECEEKQRGHRLPQPAAGQPLDQPASPEPQRALLADFQSTLVSDSSKTAEVPAPTATTTPQNLTSRPIESATVEEIVSPQLPIASSSAASDSDVPVSDVAGDIPTDSPSSDNAAPFLSSALPSESWFAANKYVLGALFVVALVIGAIVWLR